MTVKCKVSFHIVKYFISILSFFETSNLVFAATIKSQPVAVKVSSIELSCSLQNVRCVNITAGATQEYATIQSASDAAQAGDTIQVYPGTYAGFRVSKSGTSSAPITFRALGLVKITSPSSAGNGIHISNSNYITIEGFEITNTTDKCIGAREATADSPMRGLVIRNNKCLSSGHEGFYLSQVSNSLIEGNEVRNTGVSDPTRAHGIYLANAGSKNTTIRGNYIHDIINDQASGIHMNGDLSIGGDGIISGLLIENNIFDNIASHNVLNMDGVQSSIVRNNLAYNVGKNGIRGYAIDGGAGPKNMIIYNNTFVVGSGGNPIKFTEDVGGHIIFNNILLSTSSGVESISFEKSANITSSNNIVMSGYNLDGSSIVSNVNSVFRNPAGSDYKLKTGSPAIDFGLSSFKGQMAPSTDITGRKRPQGAGIDVGSYEN